MNALLLLAGKVAATSAIGLLIGLEREWSHKEAGARSFAIAALLGTAAWLVAPVMAYVEVSVVLVLIALVNIHALRNDQPLQVTTSLALAATNVLGVLVGMGSFFLAFTCAIVITALLAWKTELISLASKLTATEIRGALLLAFITAVVYPLLPDSFIDPWKTINPRSIWLTVMIVSGLNFINYVLLRQYGTRGIRYSAVLGGLVNSAATSIFLGQELKRDPDTAATIAENFMLSDLAMIFRNGALVIIFSWVAGPQASIGTAIVLGSMMLVAGAAAWLSFVRSKKMTQQVPEETQLGSPLSLREVLSFGLLFFSLTVISGLAEHLFHTAGFLVVVVAGALASAASSAVLIGQNIHLIGASSAVIAIYLASVVGLVENVIIIYTLTRHRALGVRLSLFSLPVVFAGALALILVLFFGW
jgi:uncharacterized membrane protein (DUF4010 family)